jgi:uncharacterized protein DUF4349
MRTKTVAAAILVAVLLGLWVQGRRSRISRSAMGSNSLAFEVRVPPKLAAAAPSVHLQAGYAAADLAEPAVAAERVVEATTAVRLPHHDGLAARRLIRSGQISIELANYSEGAREADAIARSLGGYVAEAKSSSAPGDHAGGSLAIRVPAGRFDEAFRALSRLGKVRSQEIHTEDVTKAYFDLETRVRVERDAEARLRDVLRNRTAKLADIVAAERELTRIVEEIEQTEGERLFYDQQIAFSTITLELSEPGAAPEPVAAPSPLQPIETALRESVFVLASSVASLIYALAVGLPWGALIVLVWVLARRIRRARRSAQQPA